MTTENPSKNFAPDTGRIEAWRAPGGHGIRLDSGNAYTGAVITPYYDSLLSKVTAHGRNWNETVSRLKRALAEFRVRGVQTNIPFLQNVLNHDDFSTGNFSTTFIADHPELMRYSRGEDRGTKLLQYLAYVKVNGTPTPLVSKQPPAQEKPLVPKVGSSPPPSGFKQILEKGGPAAYAKALRDSKEILLTDTTWRDAHQSLLATRVRTRDLLTIGPATAETMHRLRSLECWGGATFDTALRFLYECPWKRLEKIREVIPNIPTQMLLRGANAVGYTSYADNVVKDFCKLAVKTGMDVFRVFDSLNYEENMRLGIDAVGEAGGVVEAAICYTGNVLNPRNGKYTLDYYVKYARSLVDKGAHVLCVKDMAGLLRPAAATLLIGTLRREFPNVPISLHTHDTSGNGVATLLAAIEAGIDAVDVALDAMAGTTSQPSMGALIAALEGSPRDPKITVAETRPLNTYWEMTRELYRPFESGGKSCNADVYDNEIPGGQYTNLQFQVRLAEPIWERCNPSTGSEHRSAVQVAADQGVVRCCEPSPWRHRQSDPVVQGGRRPRTVHGRQQPHGAAGPSHAL